MNEPVHTDSWKRRRAQKVWVEARDSQLYLDDKTSLRLIDWRDERVKLDDISKQSVVIASPDIGMREAIKLKQLSGQPILLVESGELVGVLDDNDFYSGLLGKHNYKAA